MTRRPNANVCRYCGKSFGTDWVAANHEEKTCPMRPEASK